MRQCVTFNLAANTMHLGVSLKLFGYIVRFRFHFKILRKMYLHLLVEINDHFRWIDLHKRRSHIQINTCAIPFKEREFKKDEVKK